MLHDIKAIVGLNKEGKIHKNLILRLRIFAVLVLVFFGLVAYDIVAKGLPALPTIMMITAGFLLGRYVFTRMTVITWDEEKEMLIMGRLDLAGFGVLILYLITRYSTHWLLAHIYHSVFLITGLTFASIFGGFLGRFEGMLEKVLKTHKNVGTEPTVTNG
jgi:hypothetical protein